MNFAILVRGKTTVTPKYIKSLPGFNTDDLGLTFELVHDKILVIRDSAGSDRCLALHDFRDGATWPRTKWRFEELNGRLKQLTRGRL